MIKMKKKILVSIIIALMVCFCTGCGNGKEFSVQDLLNGVTSMSGIHNDDESSVKETYSTRYKGKAHDKVNVAIIYGDVNNSVALPRNAESINNILYNCCYTYGEVSIIIPDGKPRVIFNASIPIIEVEGVSENKKRMIAEEQVAEINGVINNDAKPIYPEVDIFKGIIEGAMVLDGGDASTDNILLVMHSGIGTKGYMNFERDLLKADIGSLIAELRRADALPNLENVDVVWMYCGQTVSPQQELSERQKKKLMSIWEAVLTECGASSVTFTNDISSNTCRDASYPEVSVVKADTDDINPEEEEEVIDSPKEDKAFDEDAFIKPETLDKAKVNFNGNRATFVNEAAAIEAIGEVAEKLKDNPTISVYIVGTTASGDRDFCKQLSLDRANAVRNILISKGVSENRLFVSGLGYEDPWHIDDLGDDGKQIEEKAEINRKVLILDTTSPEAGMLKN